MSDNAILVWVYVSFFLGVLAQGALIIKLEMHFFPIHRYQFGLASWAAEKAGVLFRHAWSLMNRAIRGPK